jgi:hypothetical protein
MFFQNDVVGSIHQHADRLINEPPYFFAGPYPYPMDSDWVFASPTMQGKQPYWQDNLMMRYIKAAVRRVGIYKNRGWHTFRHSFRTILKANGKM